MLDEDLHDLVDAEPVGLETELLVLPVAADQRVGRIALQPLGERAELAELRSASERSSSASRRSATSRYLRTFTSRPAPSSASRAWTEVEQCGLWSSVSVVAAVIGDDLRTR